MNEVAQNIGWAVIFSAVGGVVGIALVLAASVVLTPARGVELVGMENVDEDSSPEQLQWYYKQTRAV